MSAGGPSGWGQAPTLTRLGPYRLLQRVGEGGMGVVHLGLDGDGRAVAVKVVRPHVAADPHARTRLAREVATLRRVRHPRVAEVLDAGSEQHPGGEVPFIVTRYVPGPPLDAWVAEHGPLRGADLARLGDGLGEALAAIHAAGVVHRDLKPGNVLVLDGEPVVIDFGIAHVADDVRLTSTGLVMGTPGYLSPEVVAGEDVSPATDWWGWAATMAFAATGRPPFGRGPVEVVLDRVRRADADLDGVPTSLLAAVRQALSVRPADRPHPGVLRAAVAELRAGGTPGWAASPVDAGSPVHAGGLEPGTSAPREEHRPSGAVPEAVEPQDSSPAAGPVGRPDSADADETVAVPVDAQVARAGDPSFGADDDRTQQVPATGRSGGERDARTTADREDTVAVPRDPPPTRSLPVLTPPDRSRRDGPPPDEEPWHDAPRYEAASDGDRSLLPAADAPEDRPDRSRPPAGRPARTGTLAASLVALAAVAAVVPVVAAILGGLGMVVARTVDRSSASLLRRRYERGHRRGDLALSVLGSPYHLLAATVASIPALLLPALLGVCAAFAAGLVMSATPSPGQPVALAAGAAVAGLTAWWGPGGSGFRRGSRMLARSVAPGRRGPQVAVALLVLVTVAAVLVVAQGGDPDWVPLPGPPLL